MTMIEKLNAAGLPRPLTDDEADTLLDALPRNVLEDILDPNATGGEDVEHVRRNWRALLPSLSDEFPEPAALVPVPVTLHNELPADIVVISAESMAKISGAIAAAAEFTVVTEYNVKEADQAWREIQGLLRAIEVERTKWKRPLLDLGKAIDTAAKQAVEPLEAARSLLGSTINIFNAEQRRKADEAAAAERKRQQEAADAEAKRVREENEKRAKDAAAKRLPPPPPVIPAPPPRTSAIPKPPPPIVSSAVTTRKVKELVVIDRNAIPDEVGGVFLWDLNEDAVKRLVLAGAKIPGVDIVEVEVNAGRR